MLISAGANVNHQDENKLTPLHLAAGAESLPSATEECSASDQPVHFAAHETDLVKVDQIPKFAQIVFANAKIDEESLHLVYFKFFALQNFVSSGFVGPWSKFGGIR